LKTKSADSMIEGNDRKAPRPPLNRIRPDHKCARVMGIVFANTAYDCRAVHAAVSWANRSCEKLGASIPGRPCSRAQTCRMTEDRFRLKSLPGREATNSRTDEWIVMPPESYSPPLMKNIISFWNFDGSFTLVDSRGTGHCNSSWHNGAGPFNAGCISTVGLVCIYRFPAILRRIPGRGQSER
jgi:hypothetical protein